MNRIPILLFAATTVACTIATLTFAVGGADGSNASKPEASKPGASKSETLRSPIYGVELPNGYRQWEMVGVSHEAGSFDELRGILGNDVAMKAYREGTRPFPDGTILAKLAWKHVPSSEFDTAFVPGPTTKAGVQVMVKDSKKYAATGGWGFGRFVDGKPADEAQHKTCFACHDAHVKKQDWVFTRYAP